MSRAFLVVAALLVPAAVLAQPALTSRTIDEHVRVRLPLAPCQIPNIVVRIAEVLKVPAGAEAVPEHCPDPLHPEPPMTSSESLIGMTLRDALDAVVRLDPRYRWVESDGVIVVRPIAAWDSRDCLPQASYENSLFTLMTFDLRGTGWRGAYARRPDGTLYSPCGESLKAERQK